MSRQVIQFNQVLLGTFKFQIAYYVYVFVFCGLITFIKEAYLVVLQLPRCWQRYGG